jgi:hypothetical protein
MTEVAMHEATGGAACITPQNAVGPTRRVASRTDQRLAGAAPMRSTIICIMVSIISMRFSII